MNDAPHPPRTVRQDLSPDAMVSAIEDNAVASVRSWAAWPELELREEDGLLWTLTDHPFPFFNCVASPRLSEATADEAIADSCARAAARGVSQSWWLGPAPTPSDLEERLTAAGFQKLDEMVGMGVDLQKLASGPSLPAGLALEEVTEGAELSRWCFALGPAFEFPRQALAAWRRCYEALGYGPDRPWRHFMALQDGVPVATASLFVGAGVASLANVGTAADLRGRGLGRILSAHALSLAREAGYRIGTLWASQAGVHMYRRLGFLPFCRGPVYVWSEPPAEP